MTKKEIETIATIRPKEMVANLKVKQLWNGYRINCFDERLEDFFENLEKNNDLLLLFKTAERQNSILGDSFMYFDIENEDIKLGLYKPDPTNQTMRLEGQKEFASIGIRVLTRSKTGLNISVKECRTANEMQVVQYSGGTSNRKHLPLDVFTINTPEIIIELGKTRTVKLDYGVLSVKQFLNKDLVDFEVNEVILPDTWPVEYLEKEIEEAFAYIKSERKTNKTRAYGQFHNQDIIAMQKPNQIHNTLTQLQKSGMIDSTLTEHYFDNYANPTSILEESMFVNSSGSGVKVEVQEGNFDYAKHLKGINDLLTLYFFGAGFDYSLSTNKGGGVKSIDEVKSQNNTTYETIKGANVLRKAQVEEFIERIMTAKGLEPEDFKDKWSFEIISNILNEEQNSIPMIVEMQTNNLISEKVAIERANPTMNENDIEAMIKEIEIKKEKENKEVVQQEKDKVV